MNINEGLNIVGRRQQRAIQRDTDSHFKVPPTYAYLFKLPPVGWLCTNAYRNVIWYMNIYANTPVINPELVILYSSLRLSWYQV